MTHHPEVPTGNRSWLDRLERAGVPCAPVLTRNDMIEHAQVLANEIVIQHDHEHAGRLRQARSAARFSRTDPEMQRGAPALGEQSREVLHELGVSEQEMTTLIDDDVVMDTMEVPA